jgi:hypothetical protein
MMGRQGGDQSQLFYLFNLERRIPACHLLRRINPEVTRVVADLHEKLAPFYSDIGRPSIDPELMIRMLIVGRAVAEFLTALDDDGASWTPDQMESRGGNHDRRA